MSVSLPLAMAQPNLDTSDHAERQKAEALFAQDKRLEALPLLEDLAQKNPSDNEILVELAAALVDHAVTLTDQDAAAKERFRARDLVQKAWELGNTSPLCENLRQLLGELPANGAIKFSDNPAVERISLAGESAFSRRDFNEAFKDYAKALELDPTNYSATLFIANTYDRKNDVAKAGKWYERAIRLNPNMETAYRYYADMLAREGDMAKARTMLIRAAVAENFRKSSREVQMSHKICIRETPSAFRGLCTSREIDLRRVGADSPINSLTGGAHAMNTTLKDLAESRMSAPPLSSSRR